MQTWIIAFAMDVNHTYRNLYIYDTNPVSCSFFIVAFVYLRIALPTNRWNEIKVVRVYGKTKAPLNPR